MFIGFVFILGIGNFAMHKAVLESGHPLFQGSVLFARWRIGTLSLLLEFLMLLAVMLLVDSGRLGWGLAYWFYTGMNGLAAWMILTRRM